MNTSEQRFIIWDPRDGDRPREDEDGNIVSDGLIGRVGPDNVYIRVYAEYDEKTRLDDGGAPHLAVGAYAQATFRLSGQTRRYQVYRVK